MSKPPLVGTRGVTAGHGQVSEELLRLAGARGPNAKLACLYNFRKGLVDLLALTQAPSADDYVPLLAYCLLKASPRRLLTDLQFVVCCAGAGRQVAAYERALLDFGAAVKCLTHLRPARLISPATPAPVPSTPPPDRRVWGRSTKWWLTA